MGKSGWRAESAMEGAMDVEADVGADPLAPYNADFDHAQEVATADAAEAIALYRKIIFSNDLQGDDAVKLRERSIVHLGKLHAKQNDGAAIDALLKELRPLFGDISKAKAAKLVRTLIDEVASIPDCVDLQVT